VVTPNLDGVEIRNWKAFDPAVEAGYKAMSEAIAKLTKPITELRRRMSLHDLKAGGPR
jgi:NTE family protein